MFKIVLLHHPYWGIHRAMREFQFLRDMRKIILCQPPLQQYQLDTPPLKKNKEKKKDEHPSSKKLLQITDSSFFY